MTSTAQPSYSEDQLLFPERRERLTHYLFRYPAKFHPPAVNAIIDRYTERGDVILDPFCGSGTLLVEAAVAGRPAIGVDVDPIAAFVSRVKTRYFDLPSLSADAAVVLKVLTLLERSTSDYSRLQFEDLAEGEIEQAGFWVPPIPNLLHWFRRYAVVDLAGMLHVINAAEMSASHKEFFLLCFASILRRCSNADPVPVSGLEVTSYMRRRDEKGRIVNPFYSFRKAVAKALVAVGEFCQSVRERVEIDVLQQDVMTLSASLKTLPGAIITSPPYHNAVDYYRRHQLEMYWLGFTKTHEERLALLPHYIGRSTVSSTHAFVVSDVINGVLARQWERKIRLVSPGRANSFKHYLASMSRAMEEFSRLLGSDARLVLIIGKSSWRGEHIPADKLLVEASSQWFDLEEALWYPVKNRYMSYSRHNKASIDQEHVVVLRRNQRPAFCSGGDNGG